MVDEDMRWEWTPCYPEALSECTDAELLAYKLEAIGYKKPGTSAMVRCENHDYDTYIDWIDEELAERNESTT